MAAVILHSVYVCVCISRPVSQALKHIFSSSVQQARFSAHHLTFLFFLSRIWRPQQLTIPFAWCWCLSFSKSTDVVTTEQPHLMSDSVHVDSLAIVYSKRSVILSWGIGEWITMRLLVFIVSALFSQRGSFLIIFLPRLLGQRSARLHKTLLRLLEHHRK